MQEGKERHRARLDELLNNALLGIEDYNQEQEIAFAWNREKFIELGEDSGYLTRYTVAPAHIHERSLEEQVAFIMWVLQGKVKQENISDTEPSKIAGEALYRSWMLSNEELETFGVGPYHMLTETLPVWISNLGYIPLTELVDEALSVELDSTAKNKVVNELMTRELVSPDEEFFTIDGVTPFFDEDDTDAENIVAEFVRNYVPAEIEKRGFTEFEDVFSRVLLDNSTEEEQKLFKQLILSEYGASFRETETLDGMKLYVQNNLKDNLEVVFAFRAADTVPTMIKRRYILLEDAIKLATKSVPEKYYGKVESMLLERMSSEGLVETFQTVYGDQSYIHREYSRTLSKYATEIHESIKPFWQKWSEAINRKIQSRRQVRNREADAKQKYQKLRQQLLEYRGKGNYSSATKVLDELASADQNTHYAQVLVVSAHLQQMIQTNVTREAKNEIMREFRECFEQYSTILASMKRVPKNIMNILYDDLAKVRHFASEAEPVFGRPDVDHYLRSSANSLETIAHSKPHTLIGMALNTAFRR